MVNRFSTALSRGLSTIPSKNFFWNLVNLFAASQASPATGDRASKASNRGLTSDQERAHGAAGAVPWKGEPNDLLGLAVATSVCRSQRSHRAKECGDLAPAGDRLGAVAAVLEGISVTLGCARRRPPVKSAAAVRHCRRLARAAAPCPRPAAWTEVHRQFWPHARRERRGGAVGRRNALHGAPHAGRRAIGRRCSVMAARCRSTATPRPAS